MSTLLDITKWTREEKLRAMEELWRDLSRTQEEVHSPEWHADVLREREEDLRSGRDEFIPWEEAKRSLRERDG